MAYTCLSCKIMRMENKEELTTAEHKYTVVLDN